MGPGMFDGIEYVLWFGFAAIIVTAIAVVVGVPIGVWWLFHHLSFQ